REEMTSAVPKEHRFARIRVQSRSNTAQSQRIRQTFLAHSPCIPSAFESTNDPGAYVGRASATSCLQARLRWWLWKKINLMTSYRHLRRCALPRLQMPGGHGLTAARTADGQKLRDPVICTLYL